MSQKTCPLCKRALSLKQVNFTTAVYMCEALKCRYPVGFDCIAVERRFEDMDKNLELTARNDDLNDWLVEVVDNSDVSNSQQNKTTNENASEETINDSLDWLNNIIEHAGDGNTENLSTTQVSSSPSGENDTELSLDDMLNFVYNIN